MKKKTKKKIKRKIKNNDKKRSVLNHITAMKNSIINAMKNEKRNIVIVMATIVLLPIFSTIIPFIKLIPGIMIDENRLRKEWPSESIFTAFTGDGKYFRGVEEYYNDIFGTRDLFIRIKNQINYSFFNYAPLLYFDQQGNYYYYDVIANNQVRNEQRSEEDIEEVLVLYSKVQDFCRDRDIEFAFMMPPNKNITYETKFLQVKIPEFSYYHRMNEQLKERFPENYVEILPALKEANNIADVFYKTDFHWNDYGAAISFGKVIDHLAMKQGLPPVFVNDFEFIDMPKFKGGQDRELSILFPKTETGITIQSKIPLNYENIPYVPSWMHWVNNNTASLDGAAVFIGDSFTPPALYAFNGTDSGIHYYFSEAYFVNWNHTEGILNKLPENTRYLIFERLQTGFLNPSELSGLFESQ